MNPLLHLGNSISNIRVHGNRRIAESSSIIQLARKRLSSSFDETSDVNRAESIITPRGQLQARAGGSEVDVIGVREAPV